MKACCRISSRLLVALVFLTGPIAASQTVPKKIAGFGSSVCNGYGDHLGRGGYIGRLREILEPEGWSIVDQSKGGDNTIKISSRFEPENEPKPGVKYLLPEKPGYAVIGLSLGNEGIKKKNESDAEAVFVQYEQGLKRIIERCRANDIEPVVTLCYTRGDFGEQEYRLTREMNILINSWDVPSVNLLGAIDDGHGRWAEGFVADPAHPNGSGYNEMAFAIVPTLFDAMREGKPIPSRTRSSGHLSVASTQKNTRPIAFSAEHEIHSFAFCFYVRTKVNGSVARIEGAELAVIDDAFEYRTRRGAVQSVAKILQPSDTRFGRRIIFRDGTFFYSAPERVLASMRGGESPTEWHQIVVSHYAARGETLFYVDGQLAGSVAERLSPQVFTLGGSTPSDLRECFVYRAALNADEVRALYDGKMLQASLELYLPLDGNVHTAYANRAQSLSRVSIDLESFPELTR